MITVFWWHQQFPKLSKIQQIPFPQKNWNKNRDRREIDKDWKTNEDYFWDNEDMINWVYEDKFITIRRNPAGGRVIVANDTEEGRRRYLLTNLDDSTREGAYVHPVRAGEYMDPIIDWTI